jgi:primosomal protein N' (replication factor Y)
MGTEQVKEKLQALFPQARIDRLDRDSTRRKGSLQSILQSFHSGETDILVGTQMVAKGHDFPGVTLVGVLAADQGLRLADFRAAERTFQLLTQVAGRAGRGDHPGEVVIQTYFPNHYSLKYACMQDYERFYEREIQFRRRFRYPPFTALANLVVRGPKEHQTQTIAEDLARTLVEIRNVRSNSRRLRVLGPAPAALFRLKGEYRFQVLLKTTSRKELNQVVVEALEKLPSRHRKRVIIDIDPVNLL